MIGIEKIETKKFTGQVSDFQFAPFFCILRSVTFTLIGPSGVEICVPWLGKESG